MIRVGSIVDSKHPQYKDFIPIVVLTKSSKYGSLGPYCLRNEKGQILENVWQFSKIYEKVPYSRRCKSRYDFTVIWQHPTEIHMINGYPTPEYWNWRNKGMNAQEAIRYPVGINGRHKCLACLWETEPGKWEYLNYLESRKKIYWSIYRDAVRKQLDFYKLKQMLQEGKNLLIIEVDGPKNGCDISSLVCDDTVLITRDILKLALNDLKYSFGHGYCLAAALLDIEMSEL